MIKPLLYPLVKTSVEIENDPRLLLRRSHFAFCVRVIVVWES